MESADVWLEHRPSIQKFIPLSPRFRMNGKLHLKGIRKLKLDDVELEVMEMHYDDCEISHLEVDKHCVTLYVAFRNFPPKYTGDVWVTYRIEADEIFWENLPEVNFRNYEHVDV